MGKTYPTSVLAHGNVDRTHFSSKHSGTNLIPKDNVFNFLFQHMVELGNTKDFSCYNQDVLVKTENDIVFGFIKKNLRLKSFQPNSPEQIQLENELRPASTRTERV
jgi:competence protein ComGF